MCYFPEVFPYLSASNSPPTVSKTLKCIISLACLQTNSVFFFSAGFYFPSQRFAFLEARVDLHTWLCSPGTYSRSEVLKLMLLMGWETEEQKDQVLVKVTQWLLVLVGLMEQVLLPVVLGCSPLVL